MDDIEILSVVAGGLGLSVHSLIPLLVALQAMVLGFELDFQTELVKMFHSLNGFGYIITGLNCTMITVQVQVEPTCPCNPGSQRSVRFILELGNLDIPVEGFDHFHMETTLTNTDHHPSVIENFRQKIMDFLVVNKVAEIAQRLLKRIGDIASNTEHIFIEDESIANSRKYIGLNLKNNSNKFVTVQYRWRGCAKIIQLEFVCGEGDTLFGEKAYVEPVCVDDDTRRHEEVVQKFASMVIKFLQIPSLEEGGQKFASMVIKYLRIPSLATVQTIITNVFTGGAGWCKQTFLKLAGQKRGRSEDDSSRICAVMAMRLSDIDPEASASKRPRV